MKWPSQSCPGNFSVIRTASSSGKGDITDRVNRLSWPQAVDVFAEALKREGNGCTWQIICPDGQIGAEAQF